MNDEVWRIAKIEADAGSARRWRLNSMGINLYEFGEEDARSMADMRLEGKRKRWSPRSRWFDIVKDEM